MAAVPHRTNELALRGGIFLPTNATPSRSSYIVSSKFAIFLAKRYGSANVGSPILLTESKILRAWLFPTLEWDSMVSESSHIRCWDGLIYRLWNRCWKHSREYGERNSRPFGWNEEHHGQTLQCPSKENISFSNCVAVFSTEKRRPSVSLLLFVCVRCNWLYVLCSKTLGEYAKQRKSHVYVDRNVGQCCF
jgi:hypothetical protein